MPIRLTLVRPREEPHVEYESVQELRIGRSPELDIALDESSVSRFHAVIQPTEGGYCVIDQGSTNGSWINGNRVSPGQPYPLHVGDLVQFARSALRVTRLNDERTLAPHFEPYTGLPDDADEDGCHNVVYVDAGGHACVRRIPIWDKCRNPIAMIRTFDCMNCANRKLQLFAVACCRQVVDRQILETQRVLDDFECLIDQNRLVGEWSGAQDLLLKLDSSLRQVLEPLRHPRHMAFGAVRLLSNSVSEYPLVSTNLLREVFFDPSALCPFDPNWLVWNNETVPKLAHTIYQDKRFELMPILADALQDAGCNSQVLLEHCHQHGRHVRGCWMLDQILWPE